ncbi:CO dehydrogenase/acetyl-CoA synthase subunit delta [Candidatus Bathyarchaeota archaeon ex4484_231]|nr:MAG: CO dehydrogenase/acetyl-CoA synthase subunit delta [Candidatus Bathyarchaeota archaeon ex4484_231]
MPREKKKETIKIGPKLLELLNKLGAIELEDVEINVDELEIQISPAVRAPPVPPKPVAPPKPEKPEVILEAPFVPHVEEYPGRIREVTLGATKKQGGSRGKTVTIGGETSPSYYLFERAPPHPPVVSLDVFDMPLSLPKALKMHVREVMDDPVAWAKMSVEKFGADVITIHLLSTDPLIKDTSPKDAAKTVEDVLQAVDVPLIVGGCGDPKKDSEVFAKVAEVAHGERVLLSSLTLDMDEAGVLGKVAKAAAEYGHLVLGFTALDLNRAKELNRKLYQFVSEDSVLMDLTTAALGYGLEYSFTIHERARLAALMGDTELQHPTLSGTTNAWAAREAWMKMGPEWEPRELRGPIWETVTALSLLLAGVDLFLMMHPRAVQTIKEVIQRFSSMGKADPQKIAEWVTVKI